MDLVIKKSERKAGLVACGRVKIDFRRQQFAQVFQIGLQGKGGVGANRVGYLPGDHRVGQRRGPVVSAHYVHIISERNDR